VELRLGVGSTIDDPGEAKDESGDNVVARDAAAGEGYAGEAERFIGEAKDGGCGCCGCGKAKSLVRDFKTPFRDANGGDDGGEGSPTGELGLEEGRTGRGREGISGAGFPLAMIASISNNSSSTAAAAKSASESLFGGPSLEFLDCSAIMESMSRSGRLSSEAPPR